MPTKLGDKRGTYQNHGKRERPAAIYKRTGRPPDPLLESPTLEVLRQRVRVWIEGTRVLESYESHERLLLDKADVLLKQIGFVVHRQPIGENDPDEIKKRRRYTEKRISLTHLRAYLKENSAGVTFNQILDACYRVEPWTDLLRTLSTHRARQAVSKLCSMGWARRETLPDGRVFYFFKETDE